MEKLLRLPYILCLSLLIYMPFHIFLSQWLSTFTGGLDGWKIAKDVILAGAVFISVVFVYAQEGFKNKAFWLFAGISWVYFLLHLLLWQTNLATDDKPALLATAYNCRLLGYAILGMAAGILGGKYFTLNKVFKITIIISTIVCLVGVIQYLLPKDFMTHFGYAVERGVKPAFFIDDKTDLPRIMSTIRDPNSLGAYLILPITILVAAWLRKPRLRMLLSGLLLLHGLALFLTFSRSAWLGAFISVVAIAFWSYKDQTIKFVKKYWLYLLTAFLILVVGAFLLRDQYVIQNYIFHSDENTQLSDSNELHISEVQKGIDGIIDQPLGHGPGTAGIVAISNEKGGLLPENYFVQIGYEVGVQGLALLIFLMILICKKLFDTNNFYSRILITSFIGITLCNLLLHIWSNETVAATWWLLAGLVISREWYN